MSFGLGLLTGGLAADVGSSGGGGGGNAGEGGYNPMIPLTTCGLYSDQAPLVTVVRVTPSFRGRMGATPAFRGRFNV